MPRSPLAARAMTLLKAGVVGCHAVGLTALGLLMATRGLPGLVSGLLGVAAVLLFFTVGQGVQVVLADARPGQLLWGSLLSYVVRVSALGGCLALFLANPDAFAGLDTVALFVGVLSAVLGWLTAEVVAAARMRVPVFDTEYRPPQVSDEAPAES